MALSEELEATIRELQPTILINDRLPGRQRLRDAGAVRSARSQPQPVGNVLDDQRGPGDTAPPTATSKSAREIIHTLCEVASKGGNLLLNVGPMADGGLHLRSSRAARGHRGVDGAQRRLIVGTTPGLEPWQHYSHVRRSATAACTSTCSRARTKRHLRARRAHQAREGRDGAFRRRGARSSRRAPR